MKNWQKWTISISVVVVLGLIVSSIVSLSLSKISETDIGTMIQDSLVVYSWTVVKHLNGISEDISQRDSAIWSEICNRPTFAEVFGVDENGVDLKPTYVSAIRSRYYVEYINDSTEVFTLDTTDVETVKTTVPALYLAMTGGNIYLTEVKRDTSWGESMADIFVSYKLVDPSTLPTAEQTVSKEEPTEPVVPIKELAEKSEDQKAIEQGLKDGSLVKLPDGTVVDKATADKQQKIGQPKPDTTKPVTKLPAWKKF